MTVEEHPDDVVGVQPEAPPSLVGSLVRFANGFVYLFFARKFIAHRVFGLAYLMQYAAVMYLYFADYEGRFLGSPLLITLPVTGVIQSFTAMYYFSFLPKKQKNPGYTTATSTLSYSFVKENAFYSLILLFAWLYTNDATYPLLKYTWPVEALFVFLPYTWRRLFPKTSFRDSFESTARTKGWLRYYFFAATWLTKAFYLWAKHYIGFYLNYLRFFNLVTPQDQRELYLLYIFSGFATTVALFLHTLRFKRYLPPQVSFTIYVASYLCTFYSYAQVAHVFVAYWGLTAVTFGGLLVNLLSINYLGNNLLFDAYQTLVMMAAYTGHLPL